LRKALPFSEKHQRVRNRLTLEVDDRTMECGWSARIVSRPPVLPRKLQQSPINNTMASVNTPKPGMKPNELCPGAMTAAGRRVVRPACLIQFTPTQRDAQ
jgi:hypothetical protein